MVRAAEGRERIWTVMARVTQRKPALIIIVVAALLLAFGMYQAPKMQIGDMHAGVPELRADSRYNLDAAMIVDKFSIGVDILTTIVETVPNGCIEYDVMSEIDRFQWRVANVPGVQSTISMPQVAKLSQRRVERGEPEVARPSAQVDHHGAVGYAHRDLHRPAEPGLQRHAGDDLHGGPQGRDDQPA